MVKRLVVDRVCKNYAAVEGPRESKVVLKDVSFSVDDGEIISIIGPTGCGKTTLLRIISGLTIPDSGRVMFNESQLVDLNNPQCAIVFQNFNLLPWRNTIGNIELGLEAKGVPKEERVKIAMYFLELVGLKGFERHHPHELSGGMQQRVGLARALAVSPQVILFDEPFNSVDIMLRESLQGEVLKILVENNKTAIFITHNVYEAVSLSDKIITLSTRPGTVKKIYTVDLPGPRSDKKVRSAEGDALVENIRRDLLEELHGKSLDAQIARSVE
ncbi:MAG TPA: ABC transporter ATP-binding protein [Nitrososphaerales archaeon]|nr:ABC transporter ATP-binding protein [Nitrososphaerales archaeon]